jgi:E3 ubiquitin-protein ligase HUWE1
MTGYIPSAIVKLFYARRNPDTTQKKQILSASATIADIMVEHLKYEVEGIIVSSKVD